MTKLRFFGVAAYELVTPDGKVILIDPFLNENPGSPVKAEDFERVDLICVTHAAYDHYGDTFAIAKRLGSPVICGAEVKADLVQKGIPATQVRATTWGIKVEVAGIEVQPVECRHWSILTLPDGQYASGNPMAFIIDTEPGVRFYHYGDTAIFSDLKLQAELYAPTHGCIGIANPTEILARNPMPGRMLTSEMSPKEGVLAAQWLGLKTVFPCHYIHPGTDPDLKEFLELAERQKPNMPAVVVLAPGETYHLNPE